MKNLCIMIKPASSLCNMRCRYCFYADVAKRRSVCSYGVMSRQVAERILENIRADLRQGDRVSFAFQGGEPSLAGLDFYRYFVAWTERWGNGIQVSYTIQTNGLCLDDEWCEFLARKHFLVGISLDLLPFCHEEARVDEQGRGTWQRVTDAIRRLARHHIEYNILCTLTEQIARYPQKVWKAITKHDFKWVQFTPCLDGLSGCERNPYALKPWEFASFYIQLFACWLSDYRKGVYYSIKLIDDIICYLAYGIPASCGMGGKCQPQLVVESDGSVFPCDFYCLDEYCLGNFKIQTLKELYTLSVQSEMRHRKENPFCEGCSYRQICGGGCKRMKKEVYTGEAGCGMRIFLDYSISDLKKIAEKEKDYNKALEQRIIRC